MPLPPPQKKNVIISLKTVVGQLCKPTTWRMKDLCQKWKAKPIFQGTWNSLMAWPDWPPPPDFVTDLWCGFNVLCPVRRPTKVLPNSIVPLRESSPQSAQVWHQFSRDLTVLPAHPHVHPQSEWAISAFWVPSYSWYSFTDPGRLGGWLRSETVYLPQGKSPIPLLTRLNVEQLRRSRWTRYRYTKPPP